MLSSGTPGIFAVGTSCQMWPLNLLWCGSRGDAPIEHRFKSPQIVGRQLAGEVFTEVRRCPAADHFEFGDEGHALTQKLLVIAAIGQQDDPIRNLAALHRPQHAPAALPFDPSAPAN